MTLKKGGERWVVQVGKCEEGGFRVGRGVGYKWTDGRTEMKERWRRLVKDLVM